MFDSCQLPFYLISLVNRRCFILVSCVNCDYIPEIIRFVLLENVPYLVIKCAE